MKATGTDVNPLAVFIANAKLSALQLSSTDLRKEIAATVRRAKCVAPSHQEPKDARHTYLEKWFNPFYLDEIERLRIAIERGNPQSAHILFSIASNLLRDYSLQDPHDLRIRRRKSPLPQTPFVEAFKHAALLFLSRLEGVQTVLPKPSVCGKALLLDSKEIRLGRRGLGTVKFDCVLTSPPYATALPYIDTQRLSLVWLGLISPAEILRLEAYLVGSREVRGETKKQLLWALLENRNGLPNAQVEYCRMLQDALSGEDGFRRQAVPMLLYRYFSDMAKAFKSICNCVKKGAPFALIVGSNHTVLGGQRFDIDTPLHLGQIARSSGWIHEETILLQTYQRYGYHMNNAVNSERLVILRAA